MRAVGAREEARDAARLREAAEIQERERRRRAEKRQLVERTRDLKRTVSELEREVRRLASPGDVCLLVGCLWASCACACYSGRNNPMFGREGFHRTQTDETDDRDEGRAWKYRVC